jgi:D-alanyl-D-alanine carboxypeptidase
MRTRRTLPLRLLRLLLVAAVLAAGLLPGPDAQAGASPWVPGPGREILAGVAPRPVPGPGQKVGARYAILVDPATGAVLWSRRSRMPAPPASLTKMLTGLAVRASLDMDAMTVASRASARQPARRLAMRRGQRLTVNQALKALMIVSANDVAVMLAEAAGGSVPASPGPWTPSPGPWACAAPPGATPTASTPPATARPPSTWPS